MDRDEIISQVLKKKQEELEKTSNWELLGTELTRLRDIKIEKLVEQRAAEYQFKLDWTEDEDLLEDELEEARSVAIEHLLECYNEVVILMSDEELAKELEDIGRTKSMSDDEK